VPVLPVTLMVTALLLWSLAVVSLVLVLATLPALLLQRFVRVTPDELEERWLGRLGDPTPTLPRELVLRQLP